MKYKEYVIRGMIGCFLLIGALRANAQTLGQDAEGNSSIVVPAATFNLDISNSTVAVFSINKEFAKKEFTTGMKNICESDLENALENVLKNNCTVFKNEDCMEKCFKSKLDKRAWIWGADVKGGIKDGLGTIFSGEKVASAVSVGGLIGWKRSWVSLRKGGASSIIAAKNVENLHRNRIDSINKGMKELQEAVKNQTGCYQCVQEPNTAGSDAYIISYERNLQNINNFKKMGIGELTNLEEKELYLKTIKDLDSRVDLNLKKLTILSQLKDSPGKLADLNKKLLIEKNPANRKEIQRQILEITKFLADCSQNNLTVENLKNEIYIDFLSVKQKIKIVYPDDKFVEPFEKSAWDSASQKLKKDVEKNEIEVAYIKKATNAESDTKEIKLLKEKYKKLIEEYEYQKTINEKLDDLNTTKDKNVSINSFLLYLRPSVKGDAYKYDLANDSTLVADRFVDRKFNGYTIELGSTYNFRTYNYIGLSTSINYTNNISALTTTTYKLEKQDTSITDGEFTTSEEIKALSGTFDSYMRYDLNFDYVYLMPMKESAESEKNSAIYLSVNPYLRHRIYDKSDKLKNNTILGLGLHAYNSADNKLMGGLFVQTTDLFGNHAGDDSSLGKRIVFGIIAKYSITGLKVEKKAN
ncbi:hypothetical protein ACFFLS_10440 [Flavobacterium procerum]|uniref:Uncharacterized protein n=1 Tax=Flavobacterium procerum TaxID=1455569 RepID=A0ABV6BPT2_9FLAO